MLKSFKQLATHSGIYGVAGLLNVAIGFVLIPLYAQFLSPNEYGILTILTVTVAFISTFLYAGMGTSVFRSVIQRDIEPKIVYSTAFFFLIAFVALGLVLLLTASAPISSILFGNETDTHHLLTIAFITAALDSVSVISLARLRIAQMPVRYVTVTSFNFLLGMMLNIVFVAFLSQGVSGVIYAGLIRSIVYAFVSFVLLLPDLRFVFSFSELKELLQFGLPLLPISIGALVLSIADRYFLGYYSTMTAVGIYSLGYKIGNLVQFPISAFQVAWPAVLFSVAKTSHAEAFYARLLIYFSLVIGGIAMIVSLFAQEIIGIAANRSYAIAWTVVPFIALSQLAFGLYYATAVGVNLKKRLDYLIIVWGVAVGVNLLLNFMLIPTLGMYGAAISTLLSYTTVVSGSIFFNRKLYRVPYDWWRFLKLALIVGVFSFAGFLFFDMPFPLRIVLKSSVVLLALLLLRLLGVVSSGELERLRSIVTIRITQGYRSFQHR